MNEQQSQNLLLKEDLLSTICNNKLNMEGELRVFASNISWLPLVKAAIYKIWVFVSRTLLPLEHSATYSFCFVVQVRRTACVQRRCILIKNHRNNLLFSYYKLALLQFERLNLNKHFECLKKDLLFALQLIYLTKCLK